MSARYTDEEAKEILRRAMESEQAADGRLQHEDLLEAAREVGIDPHAMERAAAELREERAVQGVLDERERTRKHQYWRGLVTFFIVNAFLFGLDFVTGGGLTWFFYPLLIWGFFTILRGTRLYLPKSPQVKRKAFEKERKRQRRNARELARRREEEARKRQRKNAGKNFESAVEDGVAALLGAAARGIGKALESGAPPPQKLKGEFDEYVDRKKGRAAPSQSAKQPKPEARKEPVITPPPRARVAAPDEVGEEMEEELSNLKKRMR